LTACHHLESLMNTQFFSIGYAHPNGETATHPLAHPGERLALSLLLAGTSLPRPQGIPIPATQGPYRRFVPDTRPNAPTGVFNYGF
jgi:hypothetical protein